MQKSNLVNKTLIMLLSMISLSSFITGCQQTKQKQEIAQTIPVKVNKIEPRDLEETLEYVGNIKAEDEAMVYPKISGKIIEKVKEDGSLVSKGEIIAYIDRDEVGLKFEKAPVESPLAGIVGRIYVDIGTNVNTQTPIALVVNMNKVKIDLDIPEKHLAKVSLGQEAKISVDAYPQEEFFGEVTKISPVVDLATRAAPVEITVDNPKHILKSGMFAKVRLIIQVRKNVAVIFKEAVMGREANFYVYVVENKQAVLRNITLGIRQGPYYEVRAGLKPGDRVVIMGQQRLFDGAPVEAEE